MTVIKCLNTSYFVKYINLQYDQDDVKLINYHIHNNMKVKVSQPGCGASSSSHRNVGSTSERGLGTPVGKFPSLKGVGLHWGAESPGDGVGPQQGNSDDACVGAVRTHRSGSLQELLVSVAVLTQVNDDAQDS